MVIDGLHLEGVRERRVDEVDGPRRRGAGQTA